MKHLHLDCAAGASGDMLLGMLLDLGVDFATLKTRLATCEIGGYDLIAEVVVKSGIRATQCRVRDHAGLQHHELASPNIESHTPVDHEHQHEHESHHEPEAHGHHEQDHSHSHSDHQPQHHGTQTGPHRHLKDLLAIVDTASLSERVATQAREIFTLIAEVEGGIHGKSPEEIHFHEVSGVDTAVDVLGVLLALELLAVETITCGVVAVGSGTLTCAHGTLPLPAPATAAILARRGIPYAATEVPRELLTPTGAALLAVIVDSFGVGAVLQAEKIGYGAGSRNLTDRPNVLRGILSRRMDEAAGNADFATGGATARMDIICEFRCVIDDMTPEAIGYLLQACFATGAVDAYTLPAYMKKQRLGVELTVLAPLAKMAALEACLFRESRTFGLRKQLVERVLLEREFIDVTVAGKTIRVKVGRYRGRVTAVSPEYADCAKAATELKLALAEVYAQAEHAARLRLNSD